MILMGFLKPHCKHHHNSFHILTPSTELITQIIKSRIYIRQQPTKRRHNRIKFYLEMIEVLLIHQS